MMLNRKCGPQNFTCPLEFYMAASHILSQIWDHSQKAVKIVGLVCCGITSIAQKSKLKAWLLLETLQIHKLPLMSVSIDYK